MKTSILITALFSGLMIISCKPKTQPAMEQTSTVIKADDTLKMITARVFVKPEKVDDFIGAARGIIENSNKEDGCLSYMLYQNPYEKTSFIFVETYRDQAAIDTHFGTEYFKEFGTLISDMISKPTEIKIYDIEGVR